MEVIFTMYITIGLLIGGFYLLNVFIDYEYKYILGSLKMILYTIITLLIVVLFWPLIILYYIIRNK